MRKVIFVFIGTEAEFIKLFPIILEIKKQKKEVILIASGQNDITKSKLLQIIGKDYLGLELSKESDIKKSALGLLCWWFKTFFKTKNKMKESFEQVDMNHSIMVVHGDTVSTVMGAIIGKRLGMKVAHVEAGLRSHHYFNPFPEEIDRILTSCFADYHFAPGVGGVANLQRVKGMVFDTKFNTIYDSLQYSMTIENTNTLNNKLNNQKYCVFVFHRQENLANQKLTTMLVNQLLSICEQMTCVLLLHKITEVYLHKYGLYEKLKRSSNVIITPRMDYFDFMKTLGKAEFVITDGGSNQEELCYLGKPCLIIRDSTERDDGIGENAVLWERDEHKIEKFAKDYKAYSRNPLKLSQSPSATISRILIEKCTKKRNGCEI